MTNKKVYIISIKNIVNEIIEYTHYGGRDPYDSLSYEYIWEKIDSEMLTEHESHNTYIREQWKGIKVKKKSIIAENKKEALKIYNELNDRKYKLGEQNSNYLGKLKVKIKKVNNKNSLTKEKMLKKKKNEIKSKYEKAKEKCADVKRYKRHLNHLEKELKEV